MLRRAIARACHRHDFDLLVICGEALDDPRSEKIAHNSLYQLIDRERIDGLLVLSAGLASYSGLSGLEVFLSRFRGMALCSLGVHLSGVPSVCSDNRVGMANVLSHVIVRHSRRNLAFLGAYADNAEVDSRREVFQNACEKHGIIVPPSRMLVAGLEAVTAQAVTARMLQRDPAVDAIIAANDGSAIGALRAIHSLGLHVPEQIIVTGYDDIPSAQLLDHPLTTVRQPLEQMAERAVECVASQLRGELVPSVTILPTELVVRASCGCVSHTRQAATLDTPSAAEDALAKVPDTVTLSMYQRLIQRMDIENMYVQILETAGRFSRSLDLTELELNLATYLPSIHGRDLLLALYSDGFESRMRRALRICDGYVADSTGELLRDNASIMVELCGNEMPTTVVLLAVTMREQMLGVIGFRELDSYFDYMLLRDHITSALHVVRLHDEVLRQTMMSERNAQERHAAADRTRALSALAGGVAHDLNNALGSLVALTDVVSDEIECHLHTGRAIPVEVASDLLTMKAGALRAAETVKDLMTLGRIGRTRQEPFDVARLTRRLVDDVREAVPTRIDKVVEVTCDAPAGQLVVIGSEPHVERAIGNLLRNAIEAVAAGGRVEVTAQAIDLTAKESGYESIPAGRYAVVTVTDHGVGISPDQLRRIFEPFFSTKQLGEHSGSGLGLAIVHSVVKEHSGYIDVSSHEGEGSRFSVYLPRISTPPNPSPASLPLSMGAARILVVDDDLTQLRTAKRVLSRLGYDVTTTSSGAHALDLVATEVTMALAQGATDVPGTLGFDLIIMDLGLHETDDGLAVFGKIRELLPEQRGILASGHGYLDHEEQIRESRLVWLPKPYTLESLSDAVQRALRGMEPASHET